MVGFVARMGKKKNAFKIKSGNHKDEIICFFFIS